MQSVILNCIKFWINIKTDHFFIKGTFKYRDGGDMLTAAACWHRFTVYHGMFECFSAFCHFALGSFISAQTWLSSAVDSWHPTLCNNILFESCALGDFTWINSLIYKRKNKWGFFLFLIFLSLQSTRFCSVRDSFSVTTVQTFSIIYIQHQLMSLFLLGCSGGPRQQKGKWIQVGFDTISYFKLVISSSNSS